MLRNLSIQFTVAAHLTDSVSSRSQQQSLSLCCCCGEQQQMVLIPAGSTAGFQQQQGLPEVYRRRQQREWGKLGGSRAAARFPMIWSTSSGSNLSTSKLLTRSRSGSVSACHSIKIYLPLMCFIPSIKSVPWKYILLLTVVVVRKWWCF